MSWLWFARRDRPPSGCHALAPVRDEVGAPAGYLCTWARSEDRPDGAAKVDARAIDPDGGPAWCSLVVAPADATLPFDDPAVAGALRSVLALSPARVMSTLSLDDDRWLGAITCTERVDRRLLDDPFARLAPAVILAVGPGLVGRTGPLPGPVIQRYGSDSPWPADGFAPP